MNNLTPDHAVLYYGCSCCEEHNPDGTCYPRNMVRVTKDGELICEGCFGDAPEWEYADKPENWNDEKDYFRWSDLPEAPEYVPASRIAAAEKAARVKALEEGLYAVRSRFIKSANEDDDLINDGITRAESSIRALITAAEARPGAKT
jgi:hypothetical protein